MELVNKSGEDNLREITCTVKAEALHKLGNLSEAENLFREAEILRKEKSQKGNIWPPFLYSRPGFRLWDFLLTRGEYLKVQEQARILKYSKKQPRKIFEIALSNLFLGRAYLLQSQIEEIGDFSLSETYADKSLEEAWKAGMEEFKILCLFGRATLYRLQKEFLKAMG